jgi:sterol desaturase/sphingolipid hydroxylase (fatty acid hydroxylase superfamily)
MATGSPTLLKHRGAVTVGLVSFQDLVELARLQVHDYWRLQLSFFGFFGNYATERFLLKQKLLAKLPPDVATDMFYWLFMPPLRMLARFLSVGVLILFALLLGSQVDPAMLRGFGPLSRQPTVLIVIELVVLMDLITYWAHRSFHTFPFLWRFHSLHHSAKYVRWSTTGRVHPLNELANYMVTVLPLALIGFPVNAVMPATPIVILFALFAHTQLNVSFGPLSSIFVSPRFHRWHHTHSHEGGNKNFANVFSLWDRLFGTYYLPADRMPERFGLDVDDVPESYVGQLVYPWRRRSEPAREESTTAVVPELDSARRS